MFTISSHAYRYVHVCVDLCRSVMARHARFFSNKEEKTYVVIRFGVCK